MFNRICKYICEQPITVVIVMLLIFMIIYDGKQYFQDTYDSANKEIPYVQLVNRHELKSLLSEEGKIKVLYVYATWCGACKRNFPEFIKIGDKYVEREDIRIMPVSLDLEYNMLERFIRNQKIFKTSTLYHLPTTAEEHVDVMRTLFKLGILSDGSIPMIAVVDKNNKVVLQGRVSYAKIDELLSKM